MSLAWLSPTAFAGIALVVLPLAIHLFVRQQVRRLSFPSLRFLRETQLAAFRVRRIEDAGLLLLRAAIITVAAMALAAPVWRSDARLSAHAGRVSRAIVTVGSVAEDALARLRTGAFRSTVVDRDDITDAIADAVRWLDTQPPSAREILVAGALRRGSIDRADLALIPAGIGIRFDSMTPAAPLDMTIPLLTLRNGALVRIDRPVHLTSDSTRVTSEGRETAVAADLVRITGKDQRLADAALRAALSVGIPWDDFETRIALTLPDDTPPASAADAVLRELQRRSPPRVIEPIAIPAEQLTEWSRQPGPPSATAPLADEGDRRWLWGAVLMLLVIEWALRRRTVDARVAEEARVA